MTDSTDQSAAPAPGHAADGGGEAMALLRDIANPSVYRTNGFRVIGAPVRATARDIARRSERLKLAEQVGGAVSLSKGPLPIEPPPGADTVREALRRIRDPERRLLDELFWFWPVDTTGERPDAAIAALDRGDTTTAIEIWRAGDPDGVGLHNLAVLFHAIALDIELTSESLGNDAQRRRDRCWLESFTHWREAIQHESFWSRLTQRIRELDDPRLSTGTARRIRSQLSTVLLSINARLAIAAAERGNDADTDRHIALIDESGFDAAAAERALETVLEPLRQRVLTLCRTAEPAAAADPAKAHQVAEQLLDQTAPLLASLTLLRDGHPMRESAHDEVAHRALACQIAYGNKTEDWQTSFALLTRILTVCGSASARARVDNNLQIVKQNIAFAQEFGRCWFCATRKAADGAAVEVKVHGNVRHIGTQVQWNHLTLQVPRCETCKSRESTAGGWAAAVFIVSALMGFVSCGVGPDDDAAAAIGFGGLIAGGIAAAVINNFLMAGAKSSTEASSFPGVKRKLAEGWSLGEKPAGVE